MWCLGLLRQENVASKNRQNLVQLPKEASQRVAGPVGQLDSPVCLYDCLILLVGRACAGYFIFNSPHPMAPTFTFGQLPSKLKPCHPSHPHLHSAISCKAITETSISQGSRCWFSQSRSESALHLCHAIPVLISFWTGVHTFTCVTTPYVGCIARTITAGVSY